MINTYNRLAALTVADAHTVAAVLFSNIEHQIDLKSSDAHLSYWWNKGNEQLVIRNIDTEEIMTFEEIAEQYEIARGVLLSWFYSAKTI